MTTIERSPDRRTGPQAGVHRRALAGRPSPGRRSKWKTPLPGRCCVRLLTLAWLTGWLPSRWRPLPSPRAEYPPRERGEILRRAYELLMHRQEDLAVLMTLKWASR